MTAVVHNLKPAPINQSTEFGSEQESAIRILANSLHRLNEAVARAVDAGITVELIRACRHHDSRGNWGDQLVPVIRSNQR